MRLESFSLFFSVLTEAEEQTNAPACPWLAWSQLLRTLPFPKVASWLSKAFPYMNICLCLVTHGSCRRGSLPCMLTYSHVQGKAVTFIPDQ